MKISRFVSTAALSLLLGSSAFICAQDEHDAKPQEPRPEEAKPAHPEAARPAQEEAKPPRQDEAKPPRQEETKPPKQNDELKPKRDDMKPQPRENEKQPKQNDRVDQQNRNEHPAAQRGGGGRIPDDKFHSHFGREQKFTVRRTVVEGRPRCEYGGYSFELIDAWPADWADSDDCYVDYVDGEYFLYDLLHPGIRIAIVVIM